eukprot:gene663-373_t
MGTPTQHGPPVLCAALAERCGSASRIAATRGVERSDERRSNSIKK